MPIDNLTVNFHWELPDPSNELSHDVTRLIDAINAIDSELVNHPTATVMNAAIAAAVNALVASAPGTMETLKELADALGDDPNFATTITNLIGTKLGLGGGLLTGLLSLAAVGLQLQQGSAPTAEGGVTLVASAIKYMRGGTVRELIDDSSIQTMGGKTLTTPTINGGVLSAISAGATMKDSTGTAQKLGFMGIPSKTAKTSAYTLGDDDAWFEIPTNANIAIPDNSVVPFAVGTMIAIRNTSTVAITIAMTGSDSLTQEGTTNNGSRTLAGNGIALLRKVTTTGWIAMGSHLT